MQKRGNEILINIDGAVETSFFAAQRFFSIFFKYFLEIIYRGNTLLHRTRGNIYYQFSLLT